MFSQGEANIWYFGENAGLDFNSGSPVALSNSQMFAPEGSSVISDANGELLFYTNGNTVWNRIHDTLSNGAGLQGGLSSTQSSLIIPKPGSTSIFYIFTTSQTQQAGNWNFCYSEVDMTLDGGLGGITANKNILLYTPIGEKITAVKHANNNDIWVITHAKFTNAYLTYSITSAGVNANPIIFNGGTIDTGSGDGFPSPNWGYLKVSPDGNTLASAFMVMNKVDILNFNKASGQISLRYTIDQIAPYGVEFSPNNNLLYVSSLYSPTINQYNLSLATPSAILSNVFLFPNPNPTSPSALQLGPDERIYVSACQSTQIDCIQNPNSVGLACNYARNYFSLDGRKCWLGLPNIAHFFLVPSVIEYSGVCEDDSTFFTLNNVEAYDSIQWNFGDPASGNANTSNLLNPGHIYQSLGNYIVTANYFVSGQPFSVDRSISILETPSIALGLDTFFCSFTYFPLDIEGFNVNYEYTFSEGIFDDAYTLNTFFGWQEGLQWFTVSNSCGASSDSIYVQEISPPQPFSLYGDQVLCEGTSYSIGTLPAIGNYLWQDGSTEPEHLLSEAGEYYVTVSNQCGAQSDTMLITEIIPLPSVDLGNDTTICQGSIPPLVLYPQGIFDYYGWQNPGVFGPIYVTESETYAVNVYNSCGIASDTIQVTVDALPPLDLELGEDTFICEGESLTVSIDQPGVSFLWNDGSTDSVFTTSISALIIGSALNACGQQSDTLQVFYFPIPDVDAGSDISICNATEVSLTANSNTNTYLWQNGSSQNTITVNEPGWYWVSSTNNCGVATDLVFVQLGQASEASLNVNSCEPIWVNGISYNESGIYSQTLVNISGCDSILTIDAEILNSTVNSISISDCEPILVNGISYNESGFYTQTLVNASGCDSILNIEADILNFNAQIFQQDSTLYFNGNPTSIQWIYCNTGQAIPGATQTSFVPQTSGNYGAVITIGECVDTSNCRQIIQSSASEKPGSLCDNLIVTPNPVQDQIEFILDKSSYDIKLFTSSGALLTSTIGSKEKQNVYMDNYAAAMYILQIDQCFFKIMKSR